MRVSTRASPPTRSRRSSPRAGCAAPRRVFIGVGRPSTAAILARMVHNPALVLVYESGTIGAKPFHIPLSIGDGELARDRRRVVSVPEMFNYWIGAGADRRRVPRRGAGRPLRQPQLDRDRRLRPPATRLPGAGGAPEIAASCGEVIVIAPHSTRTLVERLDFVTTVGHGDGAGRARAPRPARRGPDRGDHRPRRARARPADVRAELTPDPRGGRRSSRRARQTGWELAVADELQITEPPTDDELAALRELLAR